MQQHENMAQAVKAAVPLDFIVGQYLKLKPGKSGELVGLCPFHQEKTPSFTITVDKGLYKCFGCDAGGDVITFLKAIEGLTTAQAIKELAERGGLTGAQAQPVQVQPRPSGAMSLVAEYDYVDEDGQLVYQVQRLVGSDGKKSFRQRAWVDGAWCAAINGGWFARSGEDWRPAAEGAAGAVKIEPVRRLLFSLPDVLAADVVVLTEGEKDALAGQGLGFCTTTASGGANAPWLDEFTTTLAGKTVVILPDQDKPGIARGRMVAGKLAADCLVITLNVPKGKDLADYVAAAGAEAATAWLNACIVEGRRDAIRSRGLLDVREVLSTVDGGVSAFMSPHLRGEAVATGFERIDSLLNGGLRAGQVMILAARPAMGKTSLAMNIAHHAAANKTRVAVFSMEMSAEDLLHRMMCSAAGVSLSDFMRGDLGPDERARLNGSLNKLAALPAFKVDETAGLTLKMMDERLADFSPGLVVLDYLQLMEGDGQNRENQVSGLSRGLKILARKHRCPFIVLSQLSRAVETRGGLRPQLSDLRESGAIEQDADIVAFIYREEYYKPQDASVRGLAEVIVSKQRNGPVGVVKLGFRSYLTQFTNLPGGGHGTDNQGV